MLNKVMLIGNLGKDPELKYTQSQTAICNFSLAVSEKRKAADGSWAEHTEWINVVVFGKTAENCGQYLDKGKKAYIEGSIRTRKWQDKDGNDRYSTEVVAQNVIFLSPKSAANDGDPISGEQRQYRDRWVSTETKIPGSDSFAAPSFDDDDIPF
jgi:single-strand DNA-binding protein